MRAAVIAVSSSLLLLSITGNSLADNNVLPECRILSYHGSFNEAAYKPGVDVRGKSVVPADINAVPMGLDQQTIVVPLTIDLAKRLQNLSVQGLNLEATPGYIEIAPSGRITYNGQDLTTQIHAMCAENPPEIGAPVVPVPDRQTAPDIIESPPVKEIAPKPVAKAATPPSAPVIEAQKREPEPVQGELLEGGEYAD